MGHERRWSRPQYSPLQVTHKTYHGLDFCQAVPLIEVSKCKAYPFRLNRISEVKLGRLLKGLENVYEVLSLSFNTT